MDKVECAVCAKFFLKKFLRNLIGKHLVLKEIYPHPKNCGLCGMIGCSLEIVKTGWGKSAVATSKSDCKYFEKISLITVVLSWLRRLRGLTVNPRYFRSS